MEEISAKTILQRVSRPQSWFGINYVMNLYQGCCHGCIYCDSRSSLILRDLDILKEIAVQNDTIVKLTITTADDALSQKIEPHVTPSSARFQVLHELSRHDIFCGIDLMPILPFITDTVENITTIVHMAYENGAKFIYPMYGVTLRENQRTYYYENLDLLFPDLRRIYENTYKQNYICSCLNWQELKAALEESCKRYGILYRMDDIIAGYQSKHQYEQLSLDEL